MKQAKFDIPVLFGDHHVLEIKKIFSEVEGVSDIYISSAYNFVKIEYDENVTNEEVFISFLKDSGYEDGMGFETETFGVDPAAEGHKKHFRKSVLYGQTGETQGFKQNVTKTTRKNWPSPGMGNLETGIEG